MKPTTMFYHAPKNVKYIYLTISGSICLISVPAHDFSAYIALNTSDRK